MREITSCATPYGDPPDVRELLDSEEGQADSFDRLLNWLLWRSIHRADRDLDGWPNELSIVGAGVGSAQTLRQALAEDSRLRGDALADRERGKLIFPHLAITEPPGKALRSRMMNAAIN